MTENNNSQKWSIRIGLLVVVLTWFLFTFYQFIKSIMYNVPPSEASFWLLLTETTSVIGLAFRTVAGFIASATVLRYVFGRVAKLEAIITLRWVLIGEAIYWLSWLPSGLWSLPPFNVGIPFSLGFFIETGIPCIIQSIVLPIALVKFTVELHPEKDTRGVIKWGLVSLSTYIFVVFWLNNAVNWIYAVIAKGSGYLIDYPLNLLSFMATTIGLLIVTFCAIYFSKKSFGTESITKLNFRPIGVIITASGLYYAVIYLMWILFGSVGGWSAWYAWFLDHNLELWALSLPLIGMPLLLKQNN